ncbi:hypothetical protein GCM10010218_24750 [Streptomyces mashuensis]|uniref:Integral membrane protein n=1 Tax=Streptomyces mashuensis TaxID=33904 RepID=A0A919B1T8_9ACTN|nr:hypothetical protein [Streptomyces mashuensis]GHF42625.1 hypothetical protein GCM10010218_24750 [Streptomyces mashuensis]
MPDPVVRAGADLRLTRAAVFAAACVLLSAGGHVLASCAGVPPWTLVAGFLAVFAVVAPASGRERPLAAIAPALAVGQLALHVLFGLGQGTAAASAGRDRHLIDFAAQLNCNQPRPASTAEARQVLADAGFGPAGTGAPAPVPPAPSGGSGAVLPHLLPSLPMLLAHLLAAVVLGWLLRRGEAALWRAIRLSARSARALATCALVRALGAVLLLVRAACASAGERPVAARPYGGEDARPAREPELRHAVVRRGPPRLALAA